MKKNSAIGIHDGWEKFNWSMTVLIALTGVVVIASVYYGFRKGTRIYETYFPMADALMEMRSEASTAYLWFEEMLGGDKSKTSEDIFQRLDHADWYAKALIEGGQNPHLALLPSADPFIRNSIIHLARQLKTQRDLIVQRLGAKEISGPGSDIDQRYHLELEEFVADAIHLEMDVKQIMRQEFQTFKITALTILLGCLLLFFVTGYGFYRYERLRRKSHLEILKMELALAEKEKMAALGRMISGLSHEINNPNSFISFNIPILKEYLQELTPIIDDYARRNADFKLLDMSYTEFRQDLQKLMVNIENGSTRINNIVSNLKSFLQKRGDTRNEWVDLCRIIESATATCRSRIDGPIGNLDIEVAGDLGEFRSDPEIIEMILVHLLTNAAEACNAVDRRIRINAFVDPQRDHALVVEVRDNGSGISHHLQEKIFEPFFSTRSSRSAGGMGLFVCRTLADQIGASIEMASEPQKGSIFRLVVPRTATLEDQKGVVAADLLFVGRGDDGEA